MREEVQAIMASKVLTLDQKKTKMHDTFEATIRLLRHSAPFQVLAGLMKAAGDIFMDMKDVQRAIFAYKNLKNVCEEELMSKEKMFVYGQLGYCYRLLRAHAVAADYFKKQLELAWELKNR
mmetsp:Transcript_40118/g.38628  ORF Transcript_40118/g.38628 Transcript_40118/m.38628 type:complete len:121 (+) Transcript_40118:1020-1382(+)